MTPKEAIIKTMHLLRSGKVTTAMTNKEVVTQVLGSWNADGWISVEDELPKNKEIVFITDGEYTDTGFYDYTDDAWQPYVRWLGDITHWMPLPQPPVVSNPENTGKNCITDNDPRGYDKEGDENNVRKNKV